MLRCYSHARKKKKEAKLARQELLSAEQTRLQKMTEHAELQKQTAILAKTKAAEAIELTRLIKQREEEERKKIALIEEKKALEQQLIVETQAKSEAEQELIRLNQERLASEQEMQTSDR